MIKDGIEFKECDKCGKLCAKLEMVNWKTCKECVISELEAKNAELMEKVEGYDRNRDRLIAMGFPHFRNCKEYADKLKELEALIEKMKCGGNCKHEYWINTGGCYDQKCRFTGLDCTNCKDKWEIKGK